MMRGAAICSGDRGWSPLRCLVHGVGDTQIKKENTKTRLFLIIGIAAALLLVAAVVITLSYRNSDSYRHARQIELGERYLREMDYEQAVAEFLRAIEIEPRDPQGYIGAAEAYVALGLHEEAIEILAAGHEVTGSEEIWELMVAYEAMLGVNDTVVQGGGDANGAQPDTAGQGNNAVIDTGPEVTGPRTERWDYEDGGYSIDEFDAAGKWVKTTHYNSDGAVQSYQESEHDTAGNLVKNTVYSPDGTVLSYWENEYNAAGNMVKMTYYNPDGTVVSYSEYEHDTAGNLVKSMNYNPDGTVMIYLEHEHDAAGNLVKGTSYNPDGTVRGHREYEYDAAGNLIKETEYNPDGTVRQVIEHD